MSSKMSSFVDHLQVFTDLYSRAFLPSTTPDPSIDPSIDPTLCESVSGHRRCPVCYTTSSWGSFTDGWKVGVNDLVKELQISPLWSFLVNNPHYFHLCPQADPVDCKCAVTLLGDFCLCIITLLCTRENTTIGCDQEAKLNITDRFNSETFAKACPYSIVCFHQMCDVMVHLQYLRKVLTIDRYKDVHRCLRAAKLRPPTFPVMLRELKQLTDHHLPLRIPFTRAIAKQGPLETISTSNPGVMAVEKIVIRPSFSFALPFFDDDSIPSTSPEFATMFEEVKTPGEMPNWELMLFGSVSLSFRVHGVQSIEMKNAPCVVPMFNSFNFGLITYFLETQKIKAMKTTFFLGLLTNVCNANDGDDDGDIDDDDDNNDNDDANDGNDGNDDNDDNDDAAVCLP